jgi:hypothetical protein
LLAELLELGGFDPVSLALADVAEYGQVPLADFARPCRRLTRRWPG